jgi:hypothetical protein
VGVAYFEPRHGRWRHESGRGYALIAAREVPIAKRGSYKKEGSMMVKFFICSTAAIGTLFCGAIYPAYAAKLPRYGVFVYSSVCTEEQSGDAAGYRAVLVRDGDGDVPYWYWSEGPMEGPAQAHPLALDDKTSAIKFSVDMGSDIAEDSAGHRSVENPFIQSFLGPISDDALTLSLNGAKSQRNITIPRLRDFSHKTEGCK